MLFGWFVNTAQPTPDWVANIRPFSQIFLRMIKMIIAPLIFATLVAGIAGAGHFRQVGRMGLKAIIYFEIVTTIALVIGLLAVNITRPGDGLSLPTEESGITAQAQGWREILVHLVPESVIQAMATGDVLQIVVFSIVFGDRARAARRARQAARAPLRAASPRRCSSSRTSSCITRRSASARRWRTPSATAV